MLINSEVLSKLRKEYGEAFYLLDSVQFRKNYKELQEAFSDIYPNFNIAYSYKTNYIPKICKIVDDLGGYAEVVSEMEAELALRVGVLPEKIIWNGPIKTPLKLEELLLKGVTVNIDSLEEKNVIQVLASKHQDKLFHIGIRCNFEVNDSVLSRFGFDVEGEDFKKTLEFAKNTTNVKLVSFQCHYAKRQVEYWPARTKGMLELIKRLGVVPERIDLGGGLFGKMEDSLKAQFSYVVPTYEDYAKVVATAFKENFRDVKNKPELYIEPGTALIGDCMKFVGTVKTIKLVRGKTFATVLGSQKNISMFGINPPMKLYSMGHVQKEYKDVDFVGFTCIESDSLYHGYTGPLAKDDMIVIGNCGSYSLVMKPPFILPNFPILDISEGKIEVIKKGESFDDIFRTFIF